MTKRLLLCALLSLPVVARAEPNGSVELYGGYDQLYAFPSDEMFSDRDLLRAGDLHLGVTGLLRFGGLEAGVLAEGSRQRGSSSATTLGAGLLGGAGWDRDGYRFDLLAELGAHTYQGFMQDSGFVHADLVPPDLWLPYVGIRPGLSVALGSRLLVGIWGYLRMDLGSHSVWLNPAFRTAMPRISVGGPQVGLSLRLGLQL